MDIRFKLTIMNFLEFAVWGAYLTSMGTYVSSIGLAEKIGNFYAMQGIVSIFMSDIYYCYGVLWIFFGGECTLWSDIHFVFYQCGFLYADDCSF